MVINPTIHSETPMPTVREFISSLPPHQSLKIGWSRQKTIPMLDGTPYWVLSDSKTGENVISRLGYNKNFRTKTSPELHIVENIPEEMMGMAAPKF